MIRLRKFIGVLSLASVLATVQGDNCNAMDRKRMKNKLVGQEASSSATEEQARSLPFERKICAIRELERSLQVLQEGIQLGKLTQDEKKACVSEIVKSMHAFVTPHEQDSLAVQANKKIIQSLFVSLVQLVKDSGEDLDITLIIGLIITTSIQLLGGGLEMRVQKVICRTTDKLVGLKIVMDSGIFEFATAVDDDEEIDEEDVAPRRKQPVKKTVAGKAKSASAKKRKSKTNN